MKGRNWLSLVFLFSSPVLLSGCFAALGEGGALLVDEAAEADVLGGLAGQELRGVSLGETAEGLEVRASERVLASAELRTVLERLAGRSGLRLAPDANGFLLVTEQGLASTASRLVITSYGDIALLDRAGTSRVIGRISEERLWQVDANGNTTYSLGSVRATPIERPVQARWMPSNNARILAALRPGATVDIVRVREGWFQVTLDNGARGWVPAAAIEIFVVAAPALPPPHHDTTYSHPPGVGYTLDEISGLLEENVPTARIQMAASEACVGFRIDQQREGRLRRLGASSSLIDGLRSACQAPALLEITTSPPGADLFLRGYRVGYSPWSSPVVAAAKATISASYRNWADSVQVRVPRDSLVRVHFIVGRDTITWPFPRTRDQLAADLASIDYRTPFAASFVRPTPPKDRPGKSARVLLSAIGAIAGGVIMHSARPDSAWWIAGVAFLGGVGGWQLGQELDESAFSSRLEHFRVAEDHWRANVLDRALSNEPMRADSLQRIARAQNAKIRAANAGVRPTVTVEPRP